MLDAARDAGARRFVLAGSSSIYGDGPVLPKTEDLPIAPRSPYAASKAGAEGLVHAYHRSFGLEGVILRFFNVFGPRQSHTSMYAGAIPLFLAAGLQGLPCTLYGDGEQTRDFTYVADTVDAILRAATVEHEGLEEPINVGAGHAWSLRSLLATIESIVGRPLDLTEAAPRAGDIRHSEASIERAAAVLEWRPTTSLEEGLRQTAEALRAGAAAD